MPCSMLSRTTNVIFALVLWWPFQFALQRLYFHFFNSLPMHILTIYTVNASMFTVTVSNLPAECSEEELIAHFTSVCPTHKIANISMAYNNAQEIEECTKRGDIIRAKVRAVHVRFDLLCGSAACVIFIEI